MGLFKDDDVQGP